MGLMEQSIVFCFPEFVFQFSVALVLVGLRNQFINNFVFPLRPVLLVFIIIIIINDLLTIFYTIYQFTTKKVWLIAAMVVFSVECFREFMSCHMSMQ